MIHLLDEETINQIAAGEVIERPASVVKELVENAIDAGADVISVEIRGGGISLIRVTDNGCGIAEDELSLAFSRHTTSKISHAEDLRELHSLGFRGEALSSIAAVSRLEAVSKTPGSLTGTHLMIEGGEEILKEEIGAPDGSTFVVRDLFYNTPARRKFLKSENTESGRVYNYLERLAISRPEIAFRYIQNGVQRISTNGGGSLQAVIYSLYGRETADKLLPVSGETCGMQLTGLIGRPEASRGNRGMEIFFVNGRYVEDRILRKALEEAYRPYLMQHRFPMAFLFLTMPADEVDVNVHPSKLEVRFTRGDMLYDFVTRSVSAQLAHREWIDTVSLMSENQPKIPEKTESTGKPAVQTASMPEPFEARRWERLRETMPSYVPSPEQKPIAAGEQQELFAAKDLDERNLPEYEYIGQVFATYWLIGFRDKMMLIDQHAAHEKILFEELAARVRENRPAVQQLAPPLILHLTEREANAVEEHMPEFVRLGFEIEPFGGSDFALRGVPMGLIGIAEKQAVDRMIAELLSKPELGRTEELASRELASIACKAAVKGNMRLTDLEEIGRAHV